MELTTRAIAPRGLFERFSWNWREAWQRHTIYRRTLNELSVLSARDLDDLGIHRSEIPRIAHEAAYGK